MSDQSDQNQTTNPTPNLPDLQSTVDAALGSPAPTPTPVSQDAPTPLPPVESVAPVSVPDMPQLPSEPVVPPTTPAPSAVPPMPAEPIMSTPVTSTPMTDETPLAFASATPTPTITPPTTESVPEPASIAPVTPPPADLPPVAPAGEVKPKKGMNKVVAGIAAGLFLVFGLVGGMYAFGVLKGVPPQIARVTEGQCSPGESTSCSDLNGCTRAKDCKSTGVWGSCYNVKCSGDGGGSSGGNGTGTCTPNTTQPCLDAAGCSGKQTCFAVNGNGYWGTCTKTDPSCGSTTKVQVACKQCGGAGGLVCATLKTEPACDSALNGCNLNSDCAGTNRGECDPTLGDGRGGCADGMGCSCSDKAAIAGGNYSSCKCGATGGQNTCYHTICPTGYTCSGSGTSAFCIANSPKPKPSDVATPKPSPSPVSSMACTGLTTSKANPGIGDTVTFTCAGTVNPATISVTYRFRYTTNGGTTWSTLANATANTATMTITTCGTYDVQCQSCATLNGTLTCDPVWVGVQ